MTTIGQRQRTCNYCSIEFATPEQFRAHWDACPVRIKAGAPSEVAALRARVAELEGALVLERANRHQFSETSHAYFHGLLDIEDLLAQSDASPDRAEIARIICEARDTAERRVAKVRAAVNAAREGGDLT